MSNLFSNSASSLNISGFSSSVRAKGVITLTNFPTGLIPSGSANRTLPPGFRTRQISSNARRDQIVCDELEYAQGKNVLELGSISWKAWIDDNDIEPANLHCINISQEEIKQGERNARFSNVKPHFHLMDAHSLEFEDESFDFVYEYLRQRRIPHLG